MALFSSCEALVLPASELCARMLIFFSGIVSSSFEHVRHIYLLWVMVSRSCTGRPVHSFAFVSQLATLEPRKTNLEEDAMPGHVAKADKLTPTMICFVQSVVWTFSGTCSRISCLWVSRVHGSHPWSRCKANPDLSGNVSSIFSDIASNGICWSVFKKLNALF